MVVRERLSVNESFNPLRTLDRLIDPKSLRHDKS